MTISRLGFEEKDQFVRAVLGEIVAATHAASASGRWAEESVCAYSVAQHGAELIKAIFAFEAAKREAEYRRAGNDLRLRVREKVGAVIAEIPGGAGQAAGVALDKMTEPR